MRLEKSAQSPSCDSAERACHTWSLEKTEPESHEQKEKRKEKKGKERIRNERKGTTQIDAMTEASTG